MEALLEAKRLGVAYGRIEAVKGVSISVAAGEIVTVLGANGAGKSSLLKAIYGLVAPRGGEVRFGGRPLPPRLAHMRVASGLALAPEGRQILVSLTVDENLRLGACRRTDAAGLEQDLDAIYAQFSNLDRRRGMSASTLSGGEQQMLAIGCALMATAAAFGFGLAAAATADEELVLGYIAAKTGPFVGFSKTNETAAQMAVDEINAGGGVDGRTLRIETFDSGGKPEQAVVGVRTLVKDENVLAIIGPFSSSEARVAFPITERLKVVTMPMASSAPKPAEPSQFAFRNTSNEGYMFSQAIKTLKEKGIPARTAAIAHATDDTISKVMGTRVFPAIFKRSGIPVEKVVTFKLSAFDLSPQVSQLVSSPTDLVAVGAPPEQAIELVTEMRRQGHEGRLVASSTITLTCRSAWAHRARGPRCRRPSSPISTTGPGPSPRNSPSERAPRASERCRPSSTPRPATSSCSTPMRWSRPG